MYAQVTNNEITRINLRYPFSIPGVSLPRNPDPAFLATMGYFPMVGSEPAYDPATQRLTGPTYEIDGETIKQVYAVVDIPQAELDAQHNAAIRDQIAAIEAGQGRAVREAALGDTTHLVAIEAQIEALRQELTNV